MTGPELTAARLAKLRSEMDEAAVDGLIMTGPEAVFYATGFDSVSAGLFRNYSSSVLVTRESVWVAAPAAESAPFIHDTAITAERFVPYGTFYFESTDEISDITGMSGRHATHSDALAEMRKAVVGGAVVLTDARSEAILGSPEGGGSVTGDTILERARATKLTGEVDRIRRSAEISDGAIQTAIQRISPGLTERDLAAIVAGEMTRHGAVPRFTVVTTGRRSALADVQPSDTVVEVGDLVRFDVGCTFQGYWSDLGRTAVVGSPTPLQTRRHRAIREGLERQLTAARPGITAHQLFELAVATVEGAGITPYRRHHCGHGIGLDVYERPIVSPGSDRALEAGMTFCLETPFYELGWGGMMVEDAIVVTDDGCELLNRSSRDLAVVAA